MSILHVNLTIISLLQVINYLYFFPVNIDTYKTYKSVFCDIQSSFVNSFGVAQVSILFLIGFMMKRIFTNPDNIELYSKTTYIMIDLCGWIVPICLMVWSFLGKANELTVKCQMGSRSWANGICKYG